jgi:putative Mn2+ efflux pump MntP
MTWLLIMLICFGLAFDVFSIAVSQGSVLGTVKVRGLVLMSLMVCAWQIVTVAIGSYVGALPSHSNLSVEAKGGFILVAATIFIACGGIKIFLIQRRKAVPEIRSQIDFAKICGIAGPTSIYTLFVTMGCGFIELEAFYVAVVICVLTIGIVIGGVYLGYRNGEIDKKVYWAGGIFLIAAGVLTIFDYCGKIITR